MYNPKGNGKQKTVQQVQFIEGNPTASNGPIRLTTIQWGMKKNPAECSFTLYPTVSQSSVGLFF
ncbi:hypothetical protein [Oceanobacillus jeddahense]|uniref:Uncharacterized protein n=1 Tax=Oceanobacillus jeddahense TaxID=1462527 RepID=A0ABY5JPU4_9BACI|nr:hypothetical protein [Oceanobacillus jeddahense]UUI01106.1 hypothetical protein NP439_13645 [Oceanobacillus jeddahense]